MKLAASQRGFAPQTLTSFTVPATARRPMSPPGKKRGFTTCASQETATGFVMGGSTAPSWR